jgi:hypothetical protein
MNWKGTWFLVGLTGGLFAFIMLVERRLTPDAPPPAPRLFVFKPSEVTNIQVRLTNQLILRVERAASDAPWRLSLPIPYPAKSHAIDQLLESLEDLVAATEIPQSELKSGKRTLAEFGLDVPHATVTLQHEGQRTEVFCGERTPAGEGVYLQALNQSSIYVVGAGLLNHLPRTHDDWRDIALFSSVGFPVHRMEIRAGSRGFTLDVNHTNGNFILTRPSRARADRAKVFALLDKVVNTRVLQFVTDNLRADLEPFGLQTPEAEVLFLVGSNNQYSVHLGAQFGKSPTNDPTVVYARRLSETNIVLVPRAALEAIQITQADVRDLHLVTFAPAAVDAIEVIGSESFSVRRQTNGTWLIGDASLTLADTNTVRDWLGALSRLEGAVEKDVVTDFANPYGLAEPLRTYLLTTTVTNATGTASNRVLAELHLGFANPQTKRVFARRPDEATVYSLAQADVAQIPYEAWQLRDRRVWSFTTNQVHRVSVRHQEKIRTVQRNPNASWTIVEGEGILSNYAALEEIMYRLGELRAEAWVNRGEDKRALYGFTNVENRVTIELKNGDKPTQLALEFGGPSPNQLPYALAIVEDKTWIFEFPPMLYFAVLRDLFGPMFKATE